MITLPKPKTAVPSITIPPMPERATVDTHKTSHLAAGLFGYPAAVAAPRHEEISRGMAKAIQALVNLPVERHDTDEHHELIQSVENCFTRLFLFARAETLTTAELLYELNCYRARINEILSATIRSYSLGTTEFAIDVHNNFYIALPLLKSDQSVRGRLTCPVFADRTRAIEVTLRAS
jgi:hypothetical protein